jgi:hypothetical protein
VKDFTNRARKIDPKSAPMEGERNISHDPKWLRGFWSFWVGVLTRMTRILALPQQLFCAIPVLGERGLAKTGPGLFLLKE